MIYEWLVYDSDIFITQKKGSDKTSGVNQFGSDTFQNGSDVIRYPTAISSPAGELQQGTPDIPVDESYIFIRYIELKVT